MGASVGDNTSQNQIDTVLLCKALFGIVLAVAGVVTRLMMYAGAVYAALLIILSKNETDIICLMFAWLGVAPIFKLSADGSSVFTYLELICAIKLLFLNREINVYFLCGWLLYAEYALIGSNLDIAVWLKTILMPMLVYLFAKRLDYPALKKVSFFYSMGVLASAAIGLLRQLIPNMNLYIAYKEFGLQTGSGLDYVRVGRFSGTWYDPNYYSIQLLLVLAICILLYLRGEMALSGFCAVAVAVTFLGAYTCSKSFLIMATVLLLIFVFMLIKKKKYIFACVVIAGAPVFVRLVISGKIPLFNATIYRLLTPSKGGLNGGLTTGRFERFKIYFSVFLSRPVKLIFGNGIGVGYTDVIPHNTVIDFLDIFGIIGTCLAMFCYFSAVRPMEHSKNRSLVTLLVLPTFLFLSMIYAIELPFELTLIFAYARLGDRL